MNNVKTYLREWLTANWPGAVVFLLLGFASGAVLAQTLVTLTAAPASGTGSVTPTLTWSAPAGSTCTASGGWAGSKAVSGTQAQASITSTTTYTLSCVPPVNGSALLSWTAPTQNTDGSALTDLAGYKVYRGLGTGGLSVIQTITGGDVLTYTATGLPVGTARFAVSAVNAGGVESALTATVSKVISAPVAVVASVTVTVSKVPNPPGGFTVTDPVVFDVRWSWRDRGYVLNREVGIAPVGTPCLQDFRVGKYMRVDRKNVRLKRRTQSAVLVAACGTA